MSDPIVGYNAGLLAKCRQCQFYFGLQVPFVAGRCPGCVDALFALADEVRRGLKPGDALVIRSPRRLRREAWAHLNASLARQFPDRKILVLDDGLSLEVAREAPLQAAPTARPADEEACTCDAAEEMRIVGSKPAHKVPITAPRELLENCGSALPATLTVTIEGKSYQTCLDDAHPWGGSWTCDSGATPPAGEEACTCVSLLNGHSPGCPLAR